MIAKVVIVSAAYPYPVDSGKRVVLSGLVEYWIDRVGADNVHYVLIGDLPTAASERPGFPVHVVERPGPVEQLTNLAWHTVVRRRRSMQESLLLGRRVLNELRAVLARVDADLEVFDTVRMAQYVGSLPPGPRRVVYLDDLFSRRYAEMAAVLRRNPSARFDALGEFASTVPRPLRALVRMSRVQRTVLAAEGRLIARREDQVARSLPMSLLINRVEATMLTTRSGSTGVAVLPPRVSDPAARSRRFDGRPEFVFLGLLSLPHNAHATKMFLEHQMPRVLDLLPDTHVRIIGRAADKELCGLAERFGRHVTIEGYVEDLDAALSESAALLCPLTFGTGVKLKVIESLARGLPVLSTSVGVEGAAAGREHGCIVEDDLDQYPRLMLEVTDMATNAELSRGARRHYEDTFSPGAVKVAYDRLFPGSPLT